MWRRYQVCPITYPGLTGLDHTPDWDQRTDLTKTRDWIRLDGAWTRDWTRPNQTELDSMEHHANQSGPDQTGPTGTEYFFSEIYDT